MRRRVAWATLSLGALGLFQGCGLDREGLAGGSTGGSPSGGTAGTGGSLLGPGGFGGGFTGGTGAGGTAAGGGQAGAAATGGAAGSGAAPSGGTGSTGAVGGAAGSGGVTLVGGSGGVAQGGTGGGALACPPAQPSDGVNCSTVQSCVYGDSLSKSQCTCFSGKWQCNPCDGVMSGPCASQGDVCLYGGGSSCRCSGYQSYDWQCTYCPVSPPTPATGCATNRAAVCLYGSFACTCDYSGGRNGSWSWSCQ